MTSSIPLHDLAVEIILDIYTTCNTIDDVLALSSTCRRLRYIYASSQRLRILEHAAEAQYGPIHDITQLLTHNASQPAHAIRSVPFSMPFLKQIVHTGKVAEKWVVLYPFKKWKDNFADRRLLTDEERRVGRRAVYRLWLYSRAFHNSAHPRQSRMERSVILERAALLHNWNTSELAEMTDMYNVFRHTVHGNVCPSNGTITRNFKKRFPESDSNQLLFNVQLNFAPPSTVTASNPFSLESHSSPGLQTNQYYNSETVNNRYQSSKYTQTLHHEPGAEGWGDDIQHYYVVEDMMKMDPEQIIWLKENAPLKGQVQMYVKSLGDWFDNNGDTWSQTLEWVVRERGGDVEDVYEAVDEGESGIAK